MKGKLILCCCLLCICGLLSPLTANTQEEMTGEVNWVKGYISGIGYGTSKPSGNRVIDKLKAMRAAKVVAQRDLLEQIKGVRVISQTTVENMMLREDIIKTRVDGTIKGAEVVKQHVEWDGNTPLAIVELRVYMTGSAGSGQLSNTLINTLDLPRRYGGTGNLPIPPIPAAPSQEKPAARAKISYDSSKPVTGVVISLDGQYFERVLLPVVKTETKSKRTITIYSVKSVDPRIIRTYGVARYAETMNDAKKITYLGENIMIIPAEFVSKDNEIVIGTDAARTIKETIRYDNNYLEKAKVAIAIQ